MKKQIILLALLLLMIIQATAQRPRRPQMNTRPTVQQCIQPMHPADYEELRIMMSRQISDSRKQAAAKQAMEYNCMSASQVAGLISLLSFERNKLELAKVAWHRVYDPGNYFRVMEAMTFNSSIRDLQDHMQRYPITPLQPYPPQNPQSAGPYFHQMNADDFQAALSALYEQRFEDSKLQLARQIASDNCLSSQQVYEVLTIFAFERTRVEFAIFAYRYVYDPGNYFKTHRAFKFNSSIDELNRAIRQGKY